MPQLNLNVTLGFHFIEEGCLPILAGCDLVVEEAHRKVKGMIEYRPERVL